MESARLVSSGGNVWEGVTILMELNGCGWPRRQAALCTSTTMHITLNDNFPVEAGDNFHLRSVNFLRAVN